jgi:hypothetical protein
MIEELRDIERELDKLRNRVARLVRAVEKRRVRLSNLADEEALGEATERTIRVDDSAAIEMRAELDRTRPATGPQTRPMLRPDTRAGAARPESRLPLEQIADMLARKATKSSGIK